MLTLSFRWRQSSQAPILLTLAACSFPSGSRLRDLFGGGPWSNPEGADGLGAGFRGLWPIGRILVWKGGACEGFTAVKDPGFTGFPSYCGSSRLYRELPAETLLVSVE